MLPSEVPGHDWICHFISPDEWDDTLQEAIPKAFLASDRQLSVFHRCRVESMGDKLSDLCIESLAGFGEAHLRVDKCITLGQNISDVFSPRVYWRPDKVSEPWRRWKEAHAQIESLGGKASFPQTYRVLLARNATYPRLPDGIG